MDVVGWVAAGVLAVVAIDRLVARGVLDRRGRRPRGGRRARGAGGAAAAGALADLIEVFQPSRAHVVEERERRRDERRHPGDGAPPVDLDAGVADLRPPG
ncbi:DUF6191 domain-containing protein [uncultured Cellulomonas sp.]|uniref:DUF6191 domain-containing protein n=1 Tax=uncultured Cellulomonas sp. TaxID=189682 RepID=UPI002622B81A|nr:DUF6191 domain-containing protein [uncultured Cellulomonas sp.]